MRDFGWPNMALQRPDGMGLPRRRADLVVEARRLGTSDREAALLAALRASPPREFSFDLAVKGLLCLPFLIFTGAELRFVG